jgi:hypothetical protein
VGATGGGTGAAGVAGSGRLARGAEVVDEGETSRPSSLASWLQSVWLRCCGAGAVRFRSGIGCRTGATGGKGCEVWGLISAPSSRASDSQ